MSVHEQRDFEPAPSFRLSFVSEPGDRLKDLGDGRVLIRHKGREDRILNRTTGETTRITGRQFKVLLRDVSIVLGIGTVISVAYFLYVLV